MFSRRQISYRSSSRRSTSGLSVIAMLLILALAGVGAYFLMRDLSGPSVTMNPELSGRIGLVQNVELNLADKSGVQSVTVTVKRGDQSMTVLQQTFGTLEKTQKTSFNLKETRLPEGAFELEIRAVDGSYAGFGRGNTTTVNLPLVLDSQPPRIAVRTGPPAMYRGGSGLIVYTVSEEVSQSGVRVGKLFFPGYKQDNGAYACLFPFPIALKTGDFLPEIMARDLAGNETSSRLLVHALNRNYRSDTLNIPEAFLNFKASELAQLCPEESTPLAQYLCSNNKVREGNDETLIRVAADPANVSPRFLWSGAFRRLPRSAVKANFGDFRTYVDGNRQKIDEQTHMGLDLASVAHAEVPAAQSGRVVWVDYLGIHGNMILIEHGLGLMTQYSHLSEYDVKVGDTVKTGQIIGRTGTSGLAGGDHLHFGVLVGGVPVQPLEWLDSSWVKNNITSRININLNL
ncbi:M23 family metallopeptidase [uncultured Mailhella sp.]|uniref:M23 family metallopeptidase n=1 Tax=uncultured Mailhella sp. TaxID=1981031 RepID=UPI0025E2D8FC|nr:M23 family metallopeptidase [uncultured Mailhella sp.]